MKAITNIPALTPLLAALTIGWAGYWNTRTVTRTSPMRVLRAL